MPKYCVTVLKEVWEKADIEVEAEHGAAAERAAISLAKTDESIEWRHDETRAFDTIKVRRA